MRNKIEKRRKIIGDFIIDEIEEYCMIVMN